MNAILQAQHRSAVVRRHRHLRPRHSETDDQVGDRVNDPIRITGARAALQGGGRGRQSRHDAAGRVEAAQRGIRLNTDAIDNSAGVNTSDVEVNIKIALSLPVRDGRADARGAQRAARRDDRRGRPAGAAQQLSADARALAGAAARAGGPRLPSAPDADAGSSAGSSTARSSSCPTTWSSASGASAAQALTRPELAVLLAYAKLSLYGDLLEFERAGRSLSRARAGALFPEPAGRALSRCARAASAAARDHLDAAHQFDDQPRRARLRGAHRRPDRRARGRRSRRRSSWRATATT